MEIVGYEVDETRSPSSFSSWVVHTFSRREKMLKLREELVAAEEERLMGKKGYSVDELDKMLDSAASEVSHVG